MSGSDSNDFLDVERDRGIFTKADREYLLNEKELTEQSKRNTRYRIRKRLINGILDLQLANRLGSEDLEQVAEHVITWDRDGNPTLSGQSWLLLNLLNKVVDGDANEVVEIWTDDFERLFTSLVENENPDSIVDVSVDVDIEVSNPNDEVLISKYEDNSENYKELKYLRDQDLVKFDDTYLKHLLGHFWEMDREFSLMDSQGEMHSVDSDNFNSAESFQQAGLEIVREIDPSIFSNEDSSEE